MDPPFGKVASTACRMAFGTAAALDGSPNRPGESTSLVALPACPPAPGQSTQSPPPVLVEESVDWTVAGWRGWGVHVWDTDFTSDIKSKGIGCVRKLHDLCSEWIVFQSTKLWPGVQLHGGATTSVHDDRSAVRAQFPVVTQRPSIRPSGPWR